MQPVGGGTMDGFYNALIICGVLTIFIALLYFFLSKSKLGKFIKTYEDRKNELNDIVSDAEHMVDELNRISGYVADQIEQKSDELNNSIKSAEDMLEDLSKRAELIVKAANEKTSLAVNGSFASKAKTAAAYAKHYRNNHTSQLGKKEKVIQFNNKYSEVMRLSQEGMGSLEIARELNIGKGEVELFLGLRK